MVLSEPWLTLVALVALAILLPFILEPRAMDDPDQADPTDGGGGD